MMKIALPILLAGIVMIAGIFAFMPIDMASTVHTTLQSSTAATTAHDLLQTLAASTTQTTNIQGGQLNNVNATFDSDLSSNATATCTSGSFLVYWTFTNNTAGAISDGGTALGIDDGVGNDHPDIAITLSPLNQTTISGVMAGSEGETITFSGNSTGGESGLQSFEDTGDLSLTVICQSTARPLLAPAP